jgi:ectoine hydroxylase-related dioxygenase (phytanoyl-CoA dioxygenase family)
LQNGIINMPGEEHHQSSWHRDFPYQNWVSTEAIGCNVFYCLDDFSEETGGTFLLPFSHKMTHMPSVPYLEKHCIQINAKAGSAVLFDSMLFHKAGYNRSKTQIRRGVNHVYAKAIVRQQINLPEMLKGKYSEDPYLNMLLGYDAQTSLSVVDFRNRRIKKNQKSY